MSRVITALEVLGLLLVAAAAGVGLTTLVGLWAGLLAAGVIVLLGAARGQAMTEGGDRGAAVRSSASRR